MTSAEEARVRKSSGSSRISPRSRLSSCTSPLGSGERKLLYRRHQSPGISLYGSVNLSNREGLTMTQRVGSRHRAYAPPSASISTASMKILITCSAIKFRNVNSRQCSKKAMAFV